MPTRLKWSMAWLKARVLSLACALKPGKRRGQVGKKSDLMPPLIVAEQLVKAYQLGGSLVAALQGISVEVTRSEYLAVTGLGFGKVHIHEPGRRA
jgi:hypothetical protein